MLLLLSQWGSNTQVLFAFISIIPMSIIIFLGWRSFHNNRVDYEFFDSLEAGSHLTAFAFYITILNDGAIAFFILVLSGLWLIALGLIRGFNIFVSMTSFLPPTVYLWFHSGHPLVIMAWVMTLQLSYYYVTRATERRVHQQRASKQRQAEDLELFSSNVLDMVSRHDQEGRFLFASPSFESGLQHSIRSLKDTSLFAYINQDDVDRVKRRIEHTLEDQTKDQVVCEYRFRMGAENTETLQTPAHYIWVESHFRFVRRTVENVEKIEWQVATRNIQDRKNTETQLQQMQKMEAVGQLSSGIAHEFNNLLMLIMGNVELGMLAADNIENDRLNQSLTDIRQTCYRARELVQQLLVFSRESELNIQPLKVEEILEEISRVTRSTFDRRIKITVDCHDDLPMAFIDQSRIYQVILNLCVNARDSIIEKLSIKPETDAQIILTCTAVTLTEEEVELYEDVEPGNFICIEVRDTGMGIEDDVQERIFDPFFTTKQAGKGTGLGLSLAYSMLKQHNGFIRVLSQLNQGTAFQLHIPAMEKDAEHSMTEISLDIDLPTGSGKIVTLASERGLRELFKLNLNRVGYDVVPASSLDEFSETKQDKADLWIIDLAGMDITRRKFVEQFRDSKLPIIFTTGNVDQPEMLALKEEFENINFIAKPFTPLDLAETVKNTLQDTPTDS